MGKGCQAALLYGAEGVLQGALGQTLEGQPSLSTMQAQIMSEKEALARLAGVKRAKASLPVMFFGTLEIAWIAPPDTASWGEGVAAKFFRKAKARKPFVHAVQQARTLHVGLVCAQERHGPCSFL